MTLSLPFVWKSRLHDVGRRREHHAYTDAHQKESWNHGDEAGGRPGKQEERRAEQRADEPSADQEPVRAPAREASSKA